MKNIISLNLQVYTKKPTGGGGGGEHSSRFDLITNFF